MAALQFFLQSEKQKNCVGEDDSHVALGRKFPVEKGSLRRWFVVMQEPVLFAGVDDMKL
jgi:hypothetical protein